MRLASIRPGDLVRVDDGLPYIAEVLGDQGRGLRVLPVSGPRGGGRAVKAVEVIGHWRQTRCRS